MILQPASKKEVSRIAVGSGICACIQVLAFWLLSLLGIGTFSYRVITGTIGGSAVAVFCFALMCITLQKATANASDEKLVKARVRSGYTVRKVIQILWVIVAFLIPGVNVLSAMIPLFFPNVVIYYLQMKGKLFHAEDTAVTPAAPASPAGSAAPVAPAEPETEETEEDLGPFEA